MFEFWPLAFCRQGNPAATLRESFEHWPIAVVEIQPSQYTDPFTIRSPITDRRRTNGITIIITGVASTPLITALQ